MLSPQVDRRTWPRYPVAIPFDMAIQVNGVSEALVAGKTVNLCRGGLWAKVNEDLPPGLRCTIQFPEPTGLTPQFRTGTIVRSAQGDGRFVVAVEFDRFPRLRAV
jgi:hypothetical protein